MHVWMSTLYRLQESRYYGGLPLTKTRFGHLQMFALQPLQAGLRVAKMSCTPCSQRRQPFWNEFIPSKAPAKLAVQPHVVLHLPMSGLLLAYMQTSCTSDDNMIHGQCGMITRNKLSNSI